MHSTVKFPPAWLWLVEELVPAYVKREYSPRESWKDKPFTKEDVRFFSKGVAELSEMFTGERPTKIPAYFNHPKFRSAYLLYFLPLQMAKFVSIFQLHPQAIDAALDHGRKVGVLRIADLGAGPGTASIGLLLQFLAVVKRAEELPPIELHWFDTNRSILRDGEEIVKALSSQFPKLRGRVTVKSHVSPWWKAADELHEPCSLILLGHVLNEARDLPGQQQRPAPKDEEDEGSETERRNPPHPVWQKLVGLAQGGGMLAVEPASKGTSQYLSRLRDQLLSSETVPAKPQSIWGPCLHAEICPLRSGRDWCHFSVPVEIPGQWFREFSKALSSERHWLKFSYLWLASEDHPGPTHDKTLRRVISDPLGRDGAVLLCEPETPRKFVSRQELARGDLIKVR